MNEILYESLNKYFKSLSIFGYKKYSSVNKLILLKFINELLYSELHFFITKTDMKFLTDLMYQLFESTCEISLPNNSANTCGNILNAIINPSIDEFVISPSGYIALPGNNSVTLNTLNVILKITSGTVLDINSLKIIYEGDIIYTGLALSNTFNINLTNPIILTAPSGSTDVATITAEISDVNGNIYTKDIDITLKVQ